MCVPIGSAQKKKQQNIDIVSANVMRERLNNETICFHKVNNSNSFKTSFHRN